MFGPGFFIGAGGQHSVGVSSGPVQNGTSGGYFAEVDAGYGPATGGSVQVNKPLGSGASGAIGAKAGVGVGAYAGVGKAGSATLTHKPLGC